MLTTWHPLSTRVGTNIATSSGLSVDIVCSLIQTTELFQQQQPLIHLVLAVKRQEREAEHSPPSSAEVKNTALHSPSWSSWRSAYSVKHRDNFTVHVLGL
jgi:hypothetical protein